MQDALLVKQHGRTVILRPADIQWISAEGDYVQINSAGRKYILRDRISRLERDFAPGEFLRIHRSLLVNRANIKELEPRPFGECFVILDDGTRLSMSRTRKNSVLRHIQEKPVFHRQTLPMLHMVAFVGCLLTFLSSFATSQQRTADSLLAVEQAFANFAAATTSDSAFLEFMAPDAILLRPDPVNGKEWIAHHPSPSLVLRWRPALGVVAASGDLGFTTGPYEDWESDDTSHARYHGEFMTAWKRQPDGHWRFVFDFGVGHAANTWKDSVAPRALRTRPIQESSTDTMSLRAQLVKSHQVSRTRFLPELLLLRPDSLPITDKSRVAGILKSEQTNVMRTPLFADVARAGDLAYTYGSFVSSRAAKVKKGYYFSIWKRSQDNSWDLLWDVLGRAR